MLEFLSWNHARIIYNNCHFNLTLMTENLQSSFTHKFANVAFRNTFVPFISIAFHHCSSAVNLMVVRKKETPLMRLLTLWGAPARQGWAQQVWCVRWRNSNVCALGSLILSSGLHKTSGSHKDPIWDFNIFFYYHTIILVVCRVSVAL